MSFTLISIIVIQTVVMTTSTDIAPSSCVINSFMRVEQALTNMSWELQSTKSELALVKTKLETTSKELDVTRKNLALKTSRIDTLEQKTQYLENVTNKINHRGDVAYQVRQMKDISLSNNEVLKFDDVTLNAGNAYNPRSGIFITPVTGTYIFWCNIMTNSQKGVAIWVKLMKEGNVLARGYTTYEITYGVATIIYITKLQKGDHVWFASESSRLPVYPHANAHYGGALLTL